MESSIEAASILVRERVEALLVIGAVAAYLGRLGAQDRLRALLVGAGAGLLASLATAWALAAFNNGAHDDTVEGLVMLLAAGLLVYVSGWLFVRQDPRAWTRYLQGHVERAGNAGSPVALAGVGFLAVYREGAETVLFLHALAARGGWTAAILLGAAAGLLLLAAGFLLVRRLAVRVPLRPLFLLTSAFLFAMALRFLADGIQEFQEQSLIPFDAAPVPDWLAALAGNPTWEVVGAQGALLAAALGTIAWKALRGTATPRPARAR